MADRPGQHVGIARTSATLGALAAALMLAPAAMAGSTGSVQVEADLVSPTTGKRIASITGSVSAKGTGYASIVPLSGAASVGMNRGEAAQVRRAADGTLLVAGGLGTRVRLGADERAARSVGVGRLALALGARRTVPVVARGVAWSAPFTPRRGQRVIVVGTATGAIRTALATRYRLVRYSPSTYSRAALLANPSLYRSVAGVLVGQNVTTAQMAGLDLARTFYNSGRWVATPGNPRALDQHMYVVAHAHLGRAGVVMRRATPPMGRTTNQYMQIREPRIAHVRVGASRRQPNTVPPHLMKAATSRSQAHLAASLAEAEPLATTRTTREAGAVRAGAPPFVPDTTGQAVLQVAVDQQINVVLTTPSWLQQVADAQNGGTNAAGSIQCSANPASGSSTYAATFNFVPALGASCPSTNQDQVGVSQQLVSLTYDNRYTVSLATGQGSGGAQQLVTETSALEASVVANPASSTGMAAGQYATASGIVQPATYGAMQWFNNGGAPCTEQPDGSVSCPPPFWQTIYNTPQEGGFTLAQGNHMISVSCAGCRGTAGGSATPVYDQQGSSPTSAVVQASSSATSGTDWEQTQSSTSGWDVDGNLGFFGGTPQGGVSGGYNSSTSSSSTTGGQFSTSTAFTLANWVTSPTANANWAVYSSSSQNLGSLSIPQASPAYPANFALSLPGPVTNGGGNAFVPLPAQYGPNNPGPTCSQAVFWAGPMLCSSGVQGAFGSQMNATDYQQGSVTSFTLDVPGNNQLAVGSVTPSVADTLYLWDQWLATGYCECSGPASWSGLGGANTIPSLGGLTMGLQVLDMDTVQAAQEALPPFTSQGTPGSPQQPGAPLNPTASATGTGIAGSITTYYGANGQVLTGVGSKSSQIAYTTLGLDLCAPPVLTSNLWSAGCSRAPGLVGRPATAAGAGPRVTAAGNALQVNAKGNDYAAPGTALTCAPGTWSGSPKFTYQWSQWNATVRGWAPIPGATTASYTPATAGTVVLCTVTATNSKGSTQASPGSVLVS